MLDVGAAAYARLLADPCAAPLVHPVYSGTQSGFLFRAESFVTYAAGATPGPTAGFVHWTPGYPNGSRSELVVGLAADGSSAAALEAKFDSPGRIFLRENTSAVRCVAACMKITYPGSEASRSGRIHLGHLPAGAVDNVGGVTYTPDGVSTLCQHYGRTPVDTLEIVWKPSVADMNWSDPAASSSPVLRDQRASVTATFAGLPDGVGLTFHFTAVYEWIPNVAAGLSGNALGKAQTRNSLDDVTDYLIAGGFKFVRGIGGALADGAMARIGGAFGLMAPRMTTRNVAQIGY
jgi:hypothetical protein